MEQKFIEGTNKQYSIRIDGIVIRNYINYRDLNTGKMTISYRKVEVYGTLADGGKRINIKINNKYTNLNVPRLVLEAFTDTKFIGRCFKILYKDNDKRNCSLNNIKICPPEGKTFSTKKEQIDKERRKARLKYQTTYKYDSNYMKKANERQKVKSKLITKSYIASKYKIKKEELSNDLYELHKAQLLVKRKLAEKTGVHINSFQ